MAQEIVGRDSGPDLVSEKSGTQTHIPGVAGKLIDSMINIKTNRQNAAVSELNQQLTAAHAGFPVNSDSMIKTAKRAGIDISSKLPDLLAQKQTNAGGGAAGEIDKTERAGPQASGGSVSMSSLGPGGSAALDPKDKKQTGNVEDPHAAAYAVDKIVDVKERQKKQTELAVDGIVRQAVTNHRLRGASDQATLEYTSTLMGLKTEALSGDPRALGKLAQSGNMSIDVPTNVFMSYTPQQKSQYLEMTRGAETDAQKASRIQGAQLHLLDSKAFTDPEAAFQAATLLADGKSLTPEIQAKMRPTSLSDMMDEVKIAHDLGDQGFTGEQVWSMARGMGLTGVSNYMPKNFQTTQQQIMAQKNRQLGIDEKSVGVQGYAAQTQRMDVTGYTGEDGKHVQGRLESEGQRAQAEADKWALESKQFGERLEHQVKTEDQKVALTQYQALVDLRRAKGSGTISDAVMQAAEKDVANRFGVSLKSVNGFTHFITGATHLEVDNDAPDTGTPQAKPDVLAPTGPKVTGVDPKATGAAMAGGDN
jgi:hypothetical protein